MLNRRKVFGIGLNKTGTSTLGQCLQQLGYRHLSHRSDLLGEWHRGNTQAVIEAARHYDSFEDWPWPLVFRELHRAYENSSKFILTVRSSPDVWLESLKKHALTTHPERPMRTLAYGYKYPHGHEREHLNFYRRHNESVIRHFENLSGQLLIICWEQGDGWRELCDFLGHDVPDVPLPHIRPNSTGIDPAIVSANKSNIEAKLRALRDIASQAARPISGDPAGQASHRSPHRKG